MEEAVIQLLNKLEEIGRSHEELYDTDVREQTGLWFIEVFINGKVTLPAPINYGMFSDIGNEAVNTAFNEFARQLRASSRFAALTEKEKWIILGEATTTASNEPADAFFGALEPYSFADQPIRQKSARHWLRTPYVYPLFLLFPGIIIFLICSVVFPSAVDGLLGVLILFVVAGTASLILGDSIWQYLSNRTYRRQDDNNA